MGNYTIFLKFENPRRGREARNFSEITENSRPQIVFRTDNFPKLSLGAPDLFVIFIFFLYDRFPTETLLILASGN